MCEWECSHIVGGRFSGEKPHEKESDFETVQCVASRQVRGRNVRLQFHTLGLSIPNRNRGFGDEWQRRRG